MWWSWVCWFALLDVWFAFVFRWLFRRVNVYKDLGVCLGELFWCCVGFWVFVVFAYAWFVNGEMFSYIFLFGVDYY